MDDELLSHPLDKNTNGMPRNRRAGKRLTGAPGTVVWSIHHPQDFQGPQIFGQYPQGFLAFAIKAMQTTDLLHVCSGSLPPGTPGVRADIRGDAKPDVQCDGRALPFKDDSFEGVLTDPPYTLEYAQSLYGTEYPRPSHLMREATRVVKPGGLIGMMHFLVPSPTPGLKLERVVGITTGTGYRIRAWTLYRKEQSQLQFEDLPHE